MGIRRWMETRNSSYRTGWMHQMIPESRVRLQEFKCHRSDSHVGIMVELNEGGWVAFYRCGLVWYAAEDRDLVSSAFANANPDSQEDARLLTNFVRAVRASRAGLFDS